jgi:DNA-binding NtrC family response regulator
MESSSVTSSNGKVRAEEGNVQQKTLREARREFERKFILAALMRHNWKVGETARELGLQRPNLYRKARQLKISIKPPGPAL